MMRLVLLAEGSAGLLQRPVASRFVRTLLTSGLMIAAGSGANAALVFNVSQNGADVVATANGTFDTSLATLLRTPSSYQAAIRPARSFISVGTGAESIFSSDEVPVFGTSTTFTTFTAASSFSGDHVSLINAIGFGLPVGYINNSVVSGISTFNNSTIASLGLTVGIYKVAVGGETVTVNIGQPFQALSAAPEPASWAMIIGGFGMVGAAMRRRKIAVRFA